MSKLSSLVKDFTKAFLLSLSHFLKVIGDSKGKKWH